MGGSGMDRQRDETTQTNDRRRKSGREGREAAKEADEDSDRGGGKRRIVVRVTDEGRRAADDGAREDEDGIRGWRVGDEKGGGMNSSFNAFGGVKGAWAGDWSARSGAPRLAATAPPAANWGPAN